MNYRHTRLFAEFRCKIYQYIPSSFSLTVARSEIGIIGNKICLGSALAGTS
jgi:hypothetical protein